MIELLAPAKVNLCLRVYGKASSGLHNLDSVVVFCQFGDKIHVQPAEKDSFHVSGPFAPLLNKIEKSRNLVIITRNIFRRISGVHEPIAIHLEKYIPVGAGLGGGSADAAATLRGLNKITKSPLNHQQLFDLATELGSDVPVCLASTPHRVTGTGDIIHPLNNIQVGALLLVNPLIPLSTAAVFKQLLPPFNVPLPKKLDHDAINLANFGNDLASTAERLVPRVKDILRRLRQMPFCHAAQMSGSGASCFGIFDDYTTAQSAGEELKQAGYWTRPTNLYLPD